MWALACFHCARAAAASRGGARAALGDMLGVARNAASPRVFLNLLLSRRVRIDRARLHRHSLMYRLLKPFVFDRRAPRERRD
jgi:hypothetical protein